jgi:hypothetical protein
VEGTEPTRSLLGGLTWPITLSRAPLHSHSCSTPVVCWRLGALSVVMRGVLVVVALASAVALADARPSDADFEQIILAAPSSARAGGCWLIAA